VKRAWYRVRAASNEVQQHEAALALMIRQLMSQSVKLVNIRAGAISESRGDIMKHYKMLYELYRPSLEAVLGTSRQFAKSTLRAKPRQGRTEPGDYSDQRDKL